MYIGLKDKNSDGDFRVRLSTPWQYSSDETIDARDNAAITWTHTVQI